MWAKRDDQAAMVLGQRASGRLMVNQSPSGVTLRVSRAWRQAATEPGRVGRYCGAGQDLERHFLGFVAAVRVALLQLEQEVARE